MRTAQAIKDHFTTVGRFRAPSRTVSSCMDFTETTGNVHLFSRQASIKPLTKGNGSSTHAVEGTNIAAATVTVTLSR